MLVEIPADVAITEVPENAMPYRKMAEESRNFIGLIQAFNAVAKANPADKAELLSASISVAMNTTAFGLIVAVPLLIAHSYLNSKTGEIVDSLEMASVKTLNIIVSAVTTHLPK